MKSFPCNLESGSLSLSVVLSRITSLLFILPELTPVVHFCMDLINLNALPGLLGRRVEQA
jgi:hypothetical protein